MLPIGVARTQIELALRTCWPTAAVKFAVVYQSWTLYGSELVIDAERHGNVSVVRVALVVTASRDAVHPLLPILATVVSSYVYIDGAADGRSEGVVVGERLGEGNEEGVREGTPEGVVVGPPDGL